MNKEYWRLKLALPLTGVAALTPLGAHAAVVNVTGRPISLGFSAASGSFVPWDVDGNGQDDFGLHKCACSFSQHIDLVSTNLNGRGLVGRSSSLTVNALKPSFRVGPTMTQFGWGYSNTFRTAIAQYVSTSNPSNISNVIGSTFTAGGFTEGDNYFGFRFLGDAGTLYGFGVINFDTALGQVSITKWAYNDTPDEEIHVEPINATEAVPGPSPIMGLALGAGWVRKMRRLSRQSKEASLDPSPLI